MAYESDDNSAFSDPYDVPVEALKLSETALELVKSTGITSIGDCLDYFLRYHDTLLTDPTEFIKTMESEVNDKLKKHGYLS